MLKEPLNLLQVLPSLIVQRESPQATVTMEQHIDTAVLQQALKQVGNYQISGIAVCVLITPGYHHPKRTNVMKQLSSNSTVWIVRAERFRTSMSTTK